MKRNVELSARFPSSLQTPNQVVTRMLRSTARHQPLLLWSSYSHCWISSDL